MDLFNGFLCLIVILAGLFVLARVFGMLFPGSFLSGLG